MIFTRLEMCICFFYKNAAKTEFAGVKVRGCNFHFTQSTLRKRRELGFTKDYYKMEEAKNVFDMLDALAFVPSDQVFEGKEIVPSLINYISIIYYAQYTVYILLIGGFPGTYS